jgi:hypothetical protein
MYCIVFKPLGINCLLLLTCQNLKPEAYCLWLVNEREYHNGCKIVYLFATELY